MTNKFNVFLILILIFLVLIFSWVSFNLNEKNNLLNDEINQIKSEYATKNQVPDLVFQKIDLCTRVQIRSSNWDFDSNDIYARDVCQKQEKSCFTATMYAMESSSSMNAFAKGNLGCGMSLSKGLLEDNSFESYEVICC